MDHYTDEKATWMPGLDNDHLTLNEVLATLPGDDASAIHWLVWLVENPKSPFAMRGAVSLIRHDAIHVILGRGILPQDEAFVIGFTMGTCRSFTGLERWIFEKISRYLYPDPYRFRKSDVLAYRLGVEFAKYSGIPKIYEAPLETEGQTALGEIRRSLGIDTRSLKEIYRKEQQLIPHSVESKRLPVE